MKIQPLLNLNFNKYQENNATPNRTKAASYDNSSLVMDYLSFRAIMAKPGVRPPRGVRTALNSARDMDVRARNLTDEAIEIANDANKTLDEISNITRTVKREIGAMQALFDKPQKDTIVKVATDERGNSVLKQYRKDNKLVRTGYFQNGKLWRIEKTAKNGTEIDILADNGLPVTYKEGLQHKGGGKNTADISIVYMNGKPVSYKEKAKFFRDGRITASKKLTFEDGKPVLSAQGVIDFADGRHLYSKGLELNDGKAVEYVENLDSTPKQGNSSTCYLLLNDNKPVQFDEICVLDGEGNRHASRRILYEEDNIKSYQVFDPNEGNCVKQIDFLEGFPVEYRCEDGVEYEF